MINLLPADTKKQIRAARMNVALRNYCVLLVVTALLLGGVFAVGFWTTDMQKTQADTSRAQSQQAAAAYQSTLTAATAFAKNLATDKTILADNVSFSKLLLTIASAVPQGVILSNLTLGATTATTPVDISAHAKTASGAINLKNSLAASPIFQNVSINSVNQADPASLAQADPTVRNYPFTIDIKAQFTKQSQLGVSK